MATELNWVSRIFKKLDEFLFNFRGSAGADYEGTSYILYLPALTGFVMGIYCFICALFRNTLPVEHVDFAMIAVWLLNEFLLIKHSFVLPGFFRKFFYPVFVAVVTIPVFIMICYGTIGFCGIVLLGITVVVFIKFIIPAMWEAAASSGSSSRSSSSGTSGGGSFWSSASDSSSNQKSEDNIVVLEDGTRIRTGFGGDTGTDMFNDYVKGDDDKWVKK